MGKENKKEEKKATTRIETLVGKRKSCSIACHCKRGDAVLASGLKNRDRVELDAVLKEGSVTVVSLLCLLVAGKGDDTDDKKDDDDDCSDDDANDCTGAKALGLLLAGLDITEASSVALLAVAEGEGARSLG